MGVVADTTAGRRAVLPAGEGRVGDIVISGLKVTVL